MHPSSARPQLWAHGCAFLPTALNRPLRWRVICGLAPLSLVLLTASSVGAQPAKLYLDSAVAALGGVEALLAIESQRIRACGENFEPAQALRLGAQGVAFLLPPAARLCRGPLSV